MECWGITDKGMVRSSNQDAFAHGQIGKALWAIVCDGMGGVSGGNIASEMAVARFKDSCENTGVALEKTASALRILDTSLDSANTLIYERASADLDLKGMGTTAVAVIVRNGAVSVGHVGDSRLYHIKNGEIIYRTKDHSMVQTLVDAGKLTEKEARNHKHKNIITRAVGASEIVNVEIDEFQADSGYLLLCSDGLTNMITDEEICEIIHEDIKKSCEKLIDVANRNGGDDNITALIIKL